MFIILLALLVLILFGRGLLFICCGSRPSCSLWCGSPATPLVAVKAPAAGRSVAKR